LRLAEEAEDFAEVVDEGGEDEPARASVGAGGFGGLDEVLDLGEFGVGVATSTRVLRYSMASQMPMRRRSRVRYSRFLRRTNSRVWLVWFRR
jgi:hypothetical protein